jgi:hypothetical protein
MAAHRIVLVNRSGDELFWGSSVLALEGRATPSNVDELDEEEPATVPVLEEESAAAAKDDDEPCPATLRSSVFVRVQGSERDEPTSSRERIIEVTLA